MKLLICLSLILLPLVSVVECRLGGGFGNAKPIKDVSDPNIKEIAKYAIEVHNKQSKENLVFERVIKGTEQVVNGKKYDLIIAAKNGGDATKNYEAVVVERTWDHSNPKTLESFKAL